MRLAIGGFGTESNSFSFDRMSDSEFEVYRGEEVLALYRLETLFGDQDDLQWWGTTRAHGNPGGLIEVDAFERIVGEMVDRLHDLVPLDGVYLDLHGASRVEGRDRAEEEILRRVRAVVGSETVISLSMDTHGHFSRELAQLVDLAVCFRQAPHVDAWEIRERAMIKLVDVVRDGRRPHKAWVSVPMLFAGEYNSTIAEPGKSLFGSIPELIDRHGVVDASLWVGFPWANEERSSAAVLVTAYDADDASRAARELAQTYWDARASFRLVADNHGTWDEALSFALSGPLKPLFISDSGDNVTAGATGDVTFALHATLKSQKVRESGLRFLFAGIVDPESVQAAVEVGRGALLERGIGACHPDGYAPPVEQSWTVEQLVPGLIEGEGAVGAVLSSGTISVMVQTGRSNFTKPDSLDELKGRKQEKYAYIDSTSYDVVVVKVGYLFPGHSDEARSWFLAITPGSADLDLTRLNLDRVARPMYPLDSQFDVDLSPVIIPPFAGDSAA